MSGTNGHATPRPSPPTPEADLEADRLELERAVLDYTVSVHTSDLSALRMDMRQLSTKHDVLAQGTNDRIDAHFRILERQLQGEFARLGKEVDGLKKALERIEKRQEERDGH